MTPTLFVCVNRRRGAGSCAGSGAWDLLRLLQEAVTARALAWEVRPIMCLGSCADGPNVKAAPGGPVLHHCGDAARVINALLPVWPPQA